MSIWNSREACFARKNSLVKFGAFGSVGSGFVDSMADGQNRSRVLRTHPYHRMTHVWVWIWMGWRWG